MTGEEMQALLPAATLRLAVREVRKRQAETSLKEARMQAEALYAAHRKAGNKSVTPVLPGGAEAGTVSIKAGTVEVKWDDPVLLALIEETDPASAEDYVPVSALTDKRVIDLIREQLPELAGRRVKPRRKAELLEIVAENGGTLANTVTGEVTQVALVFRNDPTGEFAYKPGTAGTKAILAALAAGTVTEDGEIVPQETPEGAAS